MSHQRCLYVDGREPFVHSFDPVTGLRHASYPLPGSLDGFARLADGVDALVERLPRDAGLQAMVAEREGGLVRLVGVGEFEAASGAPARLAEGAPTRTEVEAVVRERVEAWVNGPEKPDPKVECVGHINMGPCCDFAEDVVDALAERYPGLVAEVEDYEEELARSGLTANGIHYYVRIGELAFDASEPGGVPDPSLLPTCRSIRICAVPVVDGAEEESATAFGP